MSLESLLGDPRALARDATPTVHAPWQKPPPPTSYILVRRGGGRGEQTCRREFKTIAKVAVVRLLSFFSRISDSRVYRERVTISIFESCARVGAVVAQARRKRRLYGGDMRIFRIGLSGWLAGLDATE